MCKIFGGAFKPYFSSGTDNDGGLQVASTNYANASCEGKVAVPLFPENFKGKLKSVTITFKAVVTGGLTFELDTWIDNFAYSIITANATITDLKTITTKTNSSGEPLPAFTKLQPQLIWSSGSSSTVCPIVDTIEYEYELINI